MSRLAAKKKKPLADATDVTPFRLDNHVFYLFGRDIRTPKSPAEIGSYDNFPLTTRAGVFSGRSTNIQVARCRSSPTRRPSTGQRSHAVRIMVDEKLVHRHARASDRRSVVLALTPRGSHLLKQILPTVLDINDRCLAGFSKSDVENLLTRLRQMIDNIKE